MDIWSRNKRLYGHLLGMGLIAFPIYAENDAEHIASINVSAALLPGGLQESAQHPAVAGVGLPIQGSQVGDVIEAAEPSGHGVVVELPTKRR
jgi:hypothetical protein